MNNTLTKTVRIGVFSIIIISMVVSGFAGFVGINPVGTAYAASTTVIDDFDDGDTTVETSGWSGWTKGSDGSGASMVATSQNAINGSYSANISVDQGSYTQYHITPTSPIQPDRFGMRFKVTGEMDSTETDGFKLQFWDSGTKVERIRFGGNDKIYIWSSDSTITPKYHENISYDIDIQFNHSTNTHALYLDGDYIADLNFDASSIDEIGVQFDRNDGSSLTGVIVDNVEINGSSFNQQNHSNVITQFESGSKISETTGWKGFYGDTGWLNINNEDVLQGNYAGNVTASNGVTWIDIHSTEGGITPSNISYEIKPYSSRGSNEDGYNFLVKADTYILMKIELQTDNNITVDDGSVDDTGENWYAGNSYTIALRNINWTSHTFDLYVNGQFAGNHNFKQTGRPYMKTLQFGADTNQGGHTNTARYDNILINGTDPSFTSSTKTDDFDSQSADSGIPEGFTYIDGTYNTVTVTDNTSVSSPNSLFIDENVGGNDVELRPEKMPLEKSITKDVLFSIQSNTANDDSDFPEDTAIIFYEDEKELMRIGVDNQGYLTSSTASTESSQFAYVGTDEWVDITVMDINPDTDNYKIYWANSSATGTTVTIGTKRNMKYGYDEIRTGADEEGYYDDITSYTLSKSPAVTQAQAASGYTLDGYITDEQGTPLTDAIVELYNDSYTDTADYTASTNNSGYYNITGLNGTYRYKAYAPDHAEETGNVTVTSATTKNITLQYLYSQIQGHVEDTDGNSLANATVNVYVHSDGSFVGNTTTGQNGNFSSSQLWGRSYDLEIYKTGYSKENVTNVSLPDNGTNIGTVQLLNLTANNTLYGYLYDNTTGNPIEGASVAAIYTDEFGITHYELNATTDVTGYYEINLNDSRTYNVTFNHPNYEQAYTETFIDSNTKIDAYLDPSGNNTVSGYVTDTNNSAIEDATVSIDGQDVTTDTNGYYELFVDDGAYNLTASKQGYIAETLTDQTINSDVTYNFSLEESGQLKVEGYVENDKDERLDGATVYFENDTQIVDTVSTDSNGYYSTTLTEGWYHIRATKNLYQNDSTFTYIELDPETRNFTLRAEREIELEAPDVMWEHSEANYSVRLIIPAYGDTVDVTDKAIVTSSNTTILDVVDSTDHLESYGYKGNVTLNATYNNYEDNMTVIVANQTTENVAIFKDWAQMTVAIWGNPVNPNTGEAPGGEQLTMAMLFIALLVGILISSWASAFAGIGGITLTVVFGWMMGWVGDGMVLVTVFTGLFIGLNLAANVDYEIRN